MGAPAPSFDLLPLAASGVPTNVALLAAQSYAWRVRVLDGADEIPLQIEHLPDFGGRPGWILVRAASGWPAARTLDLVASQEGAPSPGFRRSFRTASGPATRPPSCAWRGPLAPSPRGPRMPEGAWPTNMPYRPHPNERTFLLPAVGAEASYRVAARVRLDADGRSYVYSGGSVAPGPAPAVTLAPPGDLADLSDDARIVAVELTDLAGQQARWGAALDG